MTPIYNDKYIKGKKKKLEDSAPGKLTDSFCAINLNSKLRKNPKFNCTKYQKKKKTMESTAELRFG